MNNVEWGFKKRKVNFDDEVENTQYARIQKLNTSDGMPTGFCIQQMTGGWWQ